MSAVEDALKGARHCAPVLERVIDILSKEPDTKFGDALDRAQFQLGVLIPQRMEGPILALAFKIIAGRKIPGAPDT